MKLTINHFTQYNFEGPVTLNLHRFYLIPQQRNYYSIISGNWNIMPLPVDINERQDAESNNYLQAWFSGESSSLQIAVNLELELKDYNPFAFILDPGLSFPFDDISYQEELSSFLVPYRTKMNLPELDQFTKKIMNQSSGIVDFLINLLAHLHKDWTHQERDEPGILPVMQVFKNRIGSCRDLSFMMMAMLRNIGIATRFVSGYAFNQELEAGHELHGWLEAFFPGAGWIGLDPSLGLFTDRNYIPLACSFMPELTLPVYGTYGGTIKSNLQTQINIKTNS
jgi:transglutaminase-like putative cysteine protease